MTGYDHMFVCWTLKDALVARTILFNGTLVQKKGMQASIKNIFKNVEGCRRGHAKTTENRCRDGSVQARHVHTKTTNVTPSLHLFFGSKIALPSNLIV